MLWDRSTLLGGGNAARSVREEASMKSSRTLGLVMIAPAAIMIVLFFLMPVVLTAVFSMTNMTTATGISAVSTRSRPIP